MPWENCHAVASQQRVSDTSRSGRSVLEGYAMLMKPNKAETAVHSCHFPGDMAVRIRKVLARPWVGVQVCHLRTDLKLAWKQSSQFLVNVYLTFFELLQGSKDYRVSLFESLM